MLGEWVKVMGRLGEWVEVGGRLGEWAGEQRGSVRAWLELL